MSVSDYLRSYNSNPLNFLDYKGKNNKFTKAAEGNTLYMGIELEAIVKDSSSDSVPHYMVEKYKNDIILKRDGSLPERGIEIVTGPQVFEAHKKFWPKFLNDFGNDLRTSSSCGMHIHLSRTAFSPLSLGKLLILFNEKENYEFIKKIAGRGSVEYSRPKHDHKVTDPIFSTNAYTQNKYSVTNVNSKGTVEIRCFASTTNVETLMSRVEFTRAAVDYVNFASLRHISSKHFISWFQKRKRNQVVYPNFSNFLNAQENV